MSDASKRHQFSMVHECVSHYKTTDLPDGGVEIVLRIPERFRNLWQVKLSELMTDQVEIDQYDSD
jgi:hypothetical protein